MTSYKEFTNLVIEIEGFLKSRNHPEATELIANVKDVMSSEFSCKPNDNADARLSELHIEAQNSDKRPPKNYKYFVVACPQ